MVDILAKRRVAGYLGASLLAMALGGCVTQVRERVVYVPADAAGNYGGSAAYPTPAASPVDRTADYMLIDTADGFAGAIGSAPPDYGFRFAGHDAWLWRGLDGEILILEQVTGGDVQYFFAAGEGAPYLIREGNRSFAYRAGRLVSVHDDSGRIIGYGDNPADRRDAATLWERGQEILAAATPRRDNGRYAANYDSGYGGWDSYWASSWASSFGISFILNDGWGGWRSDPYYRDYHDRHYYDRRYRERRWRHDGDEHFRRWRGGNRRNPPPAAPTPPPLTSADPGNPNGPIMAEPGGYIGGPSGAGGERGAWAPRPTRPADTAARRTPPSRDPMVEITPPPSAVAPPAGGPANGPSSMGDTPARAEPPVAERPRYRPPPQRVEENAPADTGMMGGNAPGGRSGDYAPRPRPEPSPRPTWRAPEPQAEQPQPAYRPPVERPAMERPAMERPVVERPAPPQPSYRAPEVAAPSPPPPPAYRPPPPPPVVRQTPQNVDDDNAQPQ